MNLFDGRLKPQSLDAAYERHAMEQGLVHNPVFPENKREDAMKTAHAWMYRAAAKEEENRMEKPTEIEDVLQERGSRYGSFEDNARISQDLKDVCTGGQELHPVFKEALDNICQKISRVVNGDQFYEDNWVDIIGYAQLALDYIRKHK